MLGIALAACVLSSGVVVIRDDLPKKHSNASIYADKRITDAAYSALPQLSLRQLSSVTVTEAGKPGAVTSPAEYFKYLPSINAMIVMDDTGRKIDVYEISNAGTFSWVKNYDVSSVGTPQSVTYNDDVVVVALDTGSRSLADGPGQIVVFNRATIKTAVAPLFFMSLTNGILPDNVVFSPDGTKLLVAIEAEPSLWTAAGKHTDEVLLRRGVRPRARGRACERRLRLPSSPERAPDGPPPVRATARGRRRAPAPRRRRAASSSSRRPTGSSRAPTRRPLSASPTSTISSTTRSPRACTCRSRRTLSSATAR